MFSFSKLANTKPLAPPSRMEPGSTNSRNHFISALNKSPSSFGNRNFDTAQNLLHKGGSGSKLRQTKLCLQKRKNLGENEENLQENVTSTSKKAATELFLLPMPRGSKEIFNKNSNQKDLKSMPTDNDKQTSNRTTEMPATNEVMMKYGRNQLVLIGKVDFCLKMNKLYPNTNALWDVYGKLVKTTIGHHSNEYILLLRRAPGGGPILQSIYYDFNKILDQFQPGCCLRAIGRFSNENRLQTYKLEKIDCESFDERFSRIQNVISFVLLQSKNQSKP